MNKLNISKNELQPCTTKDKITKVFKPFQRKYVDETILDKLKVKLNNILTISKGIIPSFNLKVKEQRLNINCENEETWLLMNYIYNEVIND